MGGGYGYWAIDINTVQFRSANGDLSTNLVQAHSHAIVDTGTSFIGVPVSQFNAIGSLVRAHTHIHAHMHTRARTCTHMHACTHTHMHVRRK